MNLRTELTNFLDRKDKSYDISSTAVASIYSYPAHRPQAMMENIPMSCNKATFVSRFCMNKSFLFLNEASQNVSRVIEQTYVLHLLAVRVALGVKFSASHGHLNSRYEALVSCDQLLQLLLLDGCIRCVRRQRVQCLHQPLHLFSLAVHFSADTLVTIYRCQRDNGFSIYFKILLNIRVYFIFRIFLGVHSSFPVRPPTTLNEFLDK